MKYKIGDRVMILKSAIEINVWPSKVGQIGVIEYESNYGGYGELDYNIKTADGTLWYVRNKDISPVNIIGKQMVF